MAPFAYVAGFCGAHHDVLGYSVVRAPGIARVVWAVGWVWRAAAFATAHSKIYTRLYNTLRPLVSALLFGLFSTIHVRGGSCAVQAEWWRAVNVRFAALVCLAGAVDVLHCDAAHVVVAGQLLFLDLHGEVVVRTAAAACCIVILATPDA